MAGDISPLADHHLPFFITPPGSTDGLMVFTAVFLIGTVLAVGTLYLRLHSLPERLAHGSRKLQFEIVAILGLISLFTHNHLFWIAGLLLAFIEIPDFSSPVASMAQSLEKMSGRNWRKPGAETPVPADDASDDATPLKADDHHA